MMEEIGRCEICGAPIYIENPWWGTVPPEPSRSCDCYPKEYVEKESIDVEDLAITSTTTTTSNMLFISDHSVVNKDGTMWYNGDMTTEYKRKFMHFNFDYGHRYDGTLVMEQLDEHTAKFAFSLCSPKEKFFSKKLGRYLAEERLDNGNFFIYRSMERPRIDNICERMKNEEHIVRGLPKWAIKKLRGCGFAPKSISSPGSDAKTDAFIDGYENGRSVAIKQVINRLESKKKIFGSSSFNFSGHDIVILLQDLIEEIEPL